MERGNLGERQQGVVEGRCWGCGVAPRDADLQPSGFREGRCLQNVAGGVSAFRVPSSDLVAMKCITSRRRTRTCRAAGVTGGLSGMEEARGLWYRIIVFFMNLREQRLVCTEPRYEHLECMTEHIEALLAHRLVQSQASQQPT